MNGSLRPFTDLRTVRVEEEFHEQFLPWEGHLARRQILGIRPSYKMPVIGGGVLGSARRGDAAISEPLSICANEP